MMMTSSTINHHGTNKFSEGMFVVDQNEQKCFDLNVYLQNNFMDPECENKSFDDADKTMQFIKCDYVSDDLTKTPLPPSPPTIIDYLIYDDFETLQKIWSEPEQMYFYLNHRQQILKPQVTKREPRTNILSGNAQPTAELPRLKVILPETGALASKPMIKARNSMTTATTSLFTVYKRQTDNDNSCNYRNDGGILKSNVTEMNVWKGPCHAEILFNWLAGENSPQRVDGKRSNCDQAREEKKCFLSLYSMIFLFNDLV